MTKQNLIDSIRTIAEYYEVKENYEKILEVSTLPKVVEMITYDMFVNKFDYRSVGDALYWAYDNIHKYAVELRSNGYVTFNT